MTTSRLVQDQLSKAWHYCSIPTGKRSARSGPQLYCSSVQYASKILTWECGESRGTHRLAPAATLRCPRGGGGKSAFEIPSMLPPLSSPFYTFFLSILSFKTLVSGKW